MGDAAGDDAVAAVFPVAVFVVFVDDGIGFLAVVVPVDFAVVFACEPVFFNLEGRPRSVGPGSLDFGFDKLGGADRVFGA